MGQSVIRTMAAVLVSVAAVVGIGATAHADDPGWGRPAPIVSPATPTPTATVANDPGWG